ncbi:hypothetical protein EMCRGX_G023144 [Ephydatia muelleri]
MSKHHKRLNPAASLSLVSHKGQMAAAKAPSQPQVATRTLEVDKSPSDQLSLLNRAILNDKEDIVLEGQKYLKVVSENANAILAIEPSGKIGKGKMGLSGVQREWLKTDVTLKLQVVPQSEKGLRQITEVVLELDFFLKSKKPQPAINTDELATKFLEKYTNNVFCRDQLLIAGGEGIVLLRAKVIKLTGPVLKDGKNIEKESVNFGILNPSTAVIFEKSGDSSLQLIGRHKGDSAQIALISPDWKFSDMGIGGLDKEFADIFRRAFSSRIFPPEIVEQMGMKHVRGILMYGPPGCGKTLMARQIGKMLHAREPKIINGPEILNKYVGESEANVRNLFAEAEVDEKKLGINSPLHIIIFDEIDAICRQRGSLSGSTGVHDTVVNQLLSKMDGVEQLNNILVIGMTNRKDMIDEALLRPGRMEVQMEIGLPDEDGRVAILKIHTKLMRAHGKLANDVDLTHWAQKAKNFSGAELEGLVRAAQATAMNKLAKAAEKVSVGFKEAEALKVTKEDFEFAFAHDVKPAFGVSDKQLNSYVYNGIIPWGLQVQEIVDRGAMAVSQTIKSSRTPLVTMLLRGSAGCGKTALAAYIAKESNFPFVKVISPENMVGFSESAKCEVIRKVFDDAYKSELSCIVLDDIEGLLDYVSVGPRFSNLVLQAVLVLLRKLPPVESHKLLVIGTTSLDDDVLSAVRVRFAFNSILEVPLLTSGAEVVALLRESSHTNTFSDEQLNELEKMLKSKKLAVGVKKVLEIVEVAIQMENHVAGLVTLLHKEALRPKKSADL